MRRRRDPSTHSRETLLGLAQQMRSDDAQEAASAVLVAHDAFEELGVDPFFPRTVSEARHVLKTGYQYISKPWTVYVPRPSFMGGGSEPHKTTYDPFRSTFHIAADNAESMFRALRWAERVKRGRFIGGRGARGTHRLRIMKKGRVVARGQDLAAVDRYNRTKGHGATLILLQKISHGRPSKYPSGILHIYFRDDATLSTNFADYKIMVDWVRGKKWFKGTPVQEI